MPEHSEGERETELPVFDAQRPNFQSFRIGLEDYIQSTLKDLETRVKELEDLLVKKKSDPGKRNPNKRKRRSKDKENEYSYPECPICQRHHKGGEAGCIHNPKRNVDKEIKETEVEIRRLQYQAKLKERHAQRTKGANDDEESQGGANTAGKRLAASAIRSLIETGDNCPESARIACIPYRPDAPQHDDVHVQAFGAIFDVNLGPCVDSGTQAGVSNDKRFVLDYDGKTYMLNGISGTPTLAEGTTNGFPTVSDKGDPILLVQPT